MSARTKWGVSIPVTGLIYVEVEASSEEDAFEKAWEAYDDGEFVLPEWEATECVSRGQVCHAMLREQTASQIPDDGGDE